MRFKLSNDNSLATLSPKRFGLISNGNWQKDKLQNFTDVTTAVLGSAVLNYLRKVAEYRNKKWWHFFSVYRSLARSLGAKLTRIKRKTFLSAQEFRDKLRIVCAKPVCERNRINIVCENSDCYNRGKSSRKQNCHQQRHTPVAIDRILYDFCVCASVF